MYTLLDVTLNTVLLVRCNLLTQKKSDGVLYVLYAGSSLGRIVGF